MCGMERTLEDIVGKSVGVKVWSITVMTTAHNCQGDGGLSWREGQNQYMMLMMAWGQARSQCGHTVKIHSTLCSYLTCTKANSKGPAEYCLNSPYKSCLIFR